MEQAMLELLRMARDGIENLERELQWPEWIELWSELVDESLA